MNLLLFSDAAEASRLPADDPRTQHIRQTLRMQVGDCFYIGIVNDRRGRAWIADIEPDGALALTCEFEAQPQKAVPLTLAAGLSRPQTMRKVLFEAGCFGIERLVVFPTEKSEPSYRTSKLWSSDEWMRHLRQGAEQAFSTTIPEVDWCESTRDALDSLRAGTASTLAALDNYEAPNHLGAIDWSQAGSIQLLVGSERGWSTDEREAFRTCEVPLCHLGARVLRTETACISAMSIALANSSLDVGSSSASPLQNCPVKG